MTVIPNSSDISRVTSQGYVPSAYVSPFGMTLIFLPMRWNNVSGTTGISRDDITCHPPWKSLKEWQSTRLLKYSNWHLFGINAHGATWTKDCLAVHCHRPCSPYMSHSFHQPYSRLFDCKGRGKPEDTRHRPYSHEKLTAKQKGYRDDGLLDDKKKITWTQWHLNKQKARESGNPITYRTSAEWTSDKSLTKSGGGAI